MTTNLAIVELGGGSTRRHLEVSNHKNSVQQVKRTNEYLEKITITVFAVGLGLGWTGFPRVFLAYVHKRC